MIIYFRWAFKVKILLVSFFLLWASVLFAKEEQVPWVEGSYTGASNFAGYALGVAIPTNADKSWTASLLYGHEHLSFPDISTSNEFVFALEHKIEEEKTIEGKFTYWVDTVNNIKYLGPSADYSYTWLQNSEDEIATITLSADLFFYSADVEHNASGTPVHRGKGTASGTSTITTTEFQPGVELEIPFFDETIVPYAFASHGFYTNSPSNIEVTLNRNNLRFNAIPLIGTHWMAGGFLKNTWELGMTFYLFENTSVLTNYGRMQSAVDDTWTTIYGITLTQELNDHFKVKAAVDRSIETGLALNYYTGGLVLLF